MMEFEEMQKIWNEQKGETMYAINETELHRIVTRKKNAANRRISRAEIMVSVINGIVAIFLFVIALRGNHNWAFLSSGLMAATVVYIQYFRWKREKAEDTFDRSIMGELDHAISNTNSIIRFNYLMLLGYLVPLSVIYISKMVVEGASIQKWLITLTALLLGFFLVRWEQNVCNIPSKKQLLTLRKKLSEE